MAEADRWICDQLNMSDFPSSSHTETSPAPADESLLRCDKHIGLIPRRRNNGQKNEPRCCVEFLRQIGRGELCFCNFSSAAQLFLLKLTPKKIIDQEKYIVEFITKDTGRKTCCLIIFFFFFAKFPPGDH